MSRLVSLVRLYPRGWRERYGTEFTDLVETLAAERSGRRARARLAFDITRGVLDAHLRGRHGMRRYLSDTALRRGVFDGLMIAAVMAVVVVLTVVVFPAGPDESDSDPAYMIELLAGYLLLGGLLVLIGVRGGGRAGSMWGGARAGAAAAFVIALLAMIDYLVVNNLFFSIVSQQHDKRVAFAASGWSSMRAYLNLRQLGGAVFVVPVAAVIGLMLGLLGGALRMRMRPPRLATDR